MSIQQPMKSTPTRAEREAYRGTGAGPVLGWLSFLFLGFLPRVAIIGFWIFGGQLGDAFSSWVIPFIGFFIAPTTTLAYALMWGVSSNAVSGAEWLVVAAAALVDLLAWTLLIHLRRS